MTDMAEAIGAVSAVGTLAGGAFTACRALHDMIKDFRHHPQIVLDLREETDSLCKVLEWLSGVVETSKNDVSVVEHPLAKCKEVCEGFSVKLQGFLSTSGETKSTFRGWAKFRYQGDDVASVRRMLANYRSLISMALTGANLQVVSLTLLTSSHF